MSGAIATVGLSAQIAAWLFAPATAAQETVAPATAAQETIGSEKADQPATAAGQTPPELRTQPPEENPQTASPPKDPPTADRPRFGKPPAPHPQQMAQSGRVHRVQMRLSGSNCMACLLDLERKLKDMQGVSKVKIERPDATSMFYFGGPGASWSEATIIYDAEIAPLQHMTSFMKTQGYHPWKVQDRVAK